MTKCHQREPIVQARGFLLRTKRVLPALSASFSRRRTRPVMTPEKITCRPSGALDVQLVIRIIDAEWNGEAEVLRMWGPKVRRRNIAPAGSRL